MLTTGEALACRLFHDQFADHRVVRIPDDLTGDARAKFVARVTAAVKQQAGLAARCDAILRVSGDIRERPDRLVIPHEKARVGLAAGFESPEERPDARALVWFSLTLLRALRAAAGEQVPHGGIQPASLMLDEAGRIKLTDFGLAPAFEASCGIEARRQVHCNGEVETDEEGVCSGEWALLSEDSSREHGWIAPFFGHELLEGKLRLNPKSDQFALGAVLFLLATGLHPYGAALSDPSLMFYFHLEPYSPQDERKDWKDVFERAEKGLTAAADKPLLAWAELVRKLLSSDPGERFGNLAEAEKLIENTAPPAWAEASRAVSDGFARLEAGDADGFLNAVSRFAEEPSLPALWQEALQGLVQRVGSQKQAIGRRKQLERRLEEGVKRLEQLELNAAREIADEVRAAPECDDNLRRLADELAQLCDEQEQMIRTGADALARSYITYARDAIAQGELDDARHALEGLLRDPATPASLAAEARQLIAEAELAGQRVERQINELTAATDDLRQGRYAAAQQRLDALIADENMQADVREQAALLLEDVRQRQAERAELSAVLEEARNAWERADLEAMRENLARVPADFDELEIQDVRADLAQRADVLAAVLAQRDQCRDALGGGDFHGAVQVADAALAAALIPQVLRDEIERIGHDARAALEEARKAAIVQARAALERAGRALASGDVNECRTVINEQVLPEIGLPEPDRLQAEEMLQACARIERAATTLHKAREFVHANRLDDATALLEREDLDAWPPELRKQAAAVQSKIAAGRAAFAERQRQAVAARLHEAEADLETGRLEEAGAALAAAAKSPHLLGDLKQRHRVLTTRLDYLRPVQAALQEAEHALEAGTAEPKTLSAMLDRLPVELPAWAAARVTQIRRSAEQIVERRRREALAAAQHALEKAEAALARGEVRSARTALEDAAAGADLDPALADRHKKALGAAARLDEWLPKVESLQSTAAKKDVAAVIRDAAALLKTDDIPPIVRKRIEELRSDAARVVEARRREITAELQELEQQVATRGRRARSVAERCDALKADALAAKEQLAAAEALRKKFEELPVPKPSRAPMLVAGGLGLVAVAVLAFIFVPRGDGGGGAGGGAGGNGGDSGGGGTVPQQNDAPAIAAALTRLNGELDSARRKATGEGRTDAGWRLEIRPADKLPATLFALPPGDAAPEKVADAPDIDSLAMLSLPAGLVERFFPKPPEPPEPDVSQRMAAALEKLKELVEQDRPPAAVTIRLEPPDRLPAAIIARNATSGQETRIGTLEESQLDAPRLAENWQESVFPPEPEPKPEPDGENATRRAAEALQKSIDAFVDSVAQQAKPDGVTDVSLTATEGGTYSLSAAFGGKPLLALDGVAFDADSGAPSVSADAAARHFTLQAAALDATSAGSKTPAQVKLVAAYDGAVEFVAALEDVELRGADGRTGVVDLSSAARLSGDQRPDAQFAITGRYSGGTLTADEAARGAFASYLAGLQKSRAADAAAALGKVVEPPDGVGFAVAPEFEGGGELPVVLMGDGDLAFATVRLPWDTKSLAYTTDAKAAERAIQGGLRMFAATDPVKERLVADWPDARNAVGLPKDAEGAGYWAGCNAVEIKASDRTFVGAFVVPVDLTVRPDGAADSDAITVGAALALTASGLTWDEEALKAESASAAAQLKKLGADPAFRKRRADAAAAALAQERGAKPEDVQVDTQADELSAKLGDDSFTSRWDALALDYSKWTAVTAPEPPAATLDEKLEVLTAKPAVTADEFADALIAVTQEKCKRYGAADLRPQRELLVGTRPAGERLAHLAGRLVGTVGARDSEDAFPTVFVEYFVGQRDVFGLSFRTSGASGQLAGESLRVWKVMPVSQLNGYASGAAIRDAVRNAALGEALLGNALGEALTGSGTGESGAFGVMLAPEGRLWMVRWDQVTFQSRPVQGMSWGDGRNLGAVTRLRPLFQETRKPDGTMGKPARAGAWCVPALGAGWTDQSSPRRQSIKLGPIGPRGAETSLKCRQIGPRAAQFTYALVTDDSIAASDDSYGSWESSLRKNNIGWKFWNYGWNGDTPPDSPITSFALPVIGN